MTKPGQDSTVLATQVKWEISGAAPWAVNCVIVVAVAIVLRWYNFAMTFVKKLRRATSGQAWLAQVSQGVWLVAISAVVACATASSTSVDARTAQADGDNGSVDAPPDASEIVIDAAVDAPVDAACVPVWSNILANGDFENGVAPWTQAPTIIRTAAQKPFAPQAGTYAALFGVSNNGNGSLTQSVVIPAAAQGLRMRGFNCFVTEDLSADADRMLVTFENAGGTVLETLANVTNSNVAATCAWTPFTWVANSAHAGETLLLQLRGTTNATLLTRFAFDGLAVEALACP